MRGLWIAAVWAAGSFAAGCFSPRPQEGAPCTTSAQCPAAQVCTPDLRCAAVGFDAGAGPKADAPAPPDAPPDGCANCPTPVARYAFDGTLADATGRHPAAAIGNGLTFVAGALGQAVRIPDSGAAHVRIEDAPDFDLTAGRIELRFRFGVGAPAGDLGLVSRDAVNSATDGHVSVRLGHDRRVVVRIQQMSAPTIQAYRCTAQPVTQNAWHKVELSFGPAGLRLTVDGALADGASWTDAGGTPTDCTAAWDRGIAGNDNPLILGGLTVTATEGTGMPVTAVASTVELDEVVVWATP
ncbi:MAG TPA: hypothetical protein VNO30_37675 [Kofleriaceae bacterium]|nr:hypothetical protein [Kofleriaceae bacterium]